MAARLITLGRVIGPWGVKGWIKVTPYADTPADLCGLAHWWVQSGGAWQEHQVTAARPHGASVVAQLAGCDDRDAAAELKGCEIAVPREALPAAGDGKVYWADLVGLKVVNLQGELLGEVTGLMATGANDVLRVASPETVRLVPFVAHVIQEVDLARGEIKVDWGLDW
ncbi:MAG: ribosome maturation factor RimM [Burkholderiales bacterium]